MSIDFEFFGCKIKIDFLFIAIIAFIFVVDKTGFVFSALLLSIAHEIGHLIAFWMSKVKIEEVNFGFANIDICKAGSEFFYDPKREVFVALSGPLMNFLIFFLLLSVYYFNREIKYFYFAVQSLAIGVINILPIESLDGGRALGLILEQKLGFEKSWKLLKIISWMFLIPITFFGVYLLLKSKYNFSILILALYLVFEIFNSSTF